MVGTGRQCRSVACFSVQAVKRSPMSPHYTGVDLKRVHPDIDPRSHEAVLAVRRDLCSGVIVVGRAWPDDCLCVAQRLT